MYRNYIRTLERNYFFSRFVLCITINCKGTFIDLFVVPEDR